VKIFFVQEVSLSSKIVHRLTLNERMLLLSKLSITEINNAGWRFSDEKVDAEWENVCNISDYNFHENEYNIHNILTDAWSHPDPLIVEFVIDGLQCGFNLCYDGARNNPYALPNHVSARKENLIVREKFEKLITERKAVGFFRNKPFKFFWVSPCALVDKSEGGFRLIRDFSAGNNSINKQTSKAVLNFDQQDQVTAVIASKGIGSLLFKFDVQSAFESLPIRKEDFNLTGAFVEDKGYVFHTRLPFGHRRSPAIWERVAELFRWLLLNKWNIPHLARWVDDYLAIGNSCIEDANSSMERVKKAAVRYGFLLHKYLGPTTELSFNGVIYDTTKMTMSIPIEKRKKAEKLVQSLLDSNLWSFKKVKSAIGLLFHIAKVCTPGRAFLSGLQSWRYKMWPQSGKHHASTVRSPTTIIRELKWWLQCFHYWKGRALIFQKICEKEEVIWSIDASPLFGIGIVCHSTGKWGNFKLTSSALKFCSTELAPSSTRLECVGPVVLLASFGSFMKGRSHKVFMDAKNSINLLNFTTISRICEVDVLLQTVAHLLVKFDTHITFVHIDRSNNKLADLLSRGNVKAFWKLAKEQGLSLENSKSTLLLPSRRMFPNALRPF